MHERVSAPAATEAKQQVTPKASPRSRAPIVQAKLTVGASNDPFERQADTVAAQVVSLLRAPEVERSWQPDAAGDDEPRIRRKSAVAGPPTRAADRSSPGSKIRRKATTESARNPAALWSNLGSKIRRSVNLISRSAVVGAEGGALDADSAGAIERLRGSGSALDGTVRRKMEGAFGADFSSVRMHVGPESDELNNRMQARAFTTGSDVFVRRKDYAPNSSAGQELLAHELTHTLQQGGAQVARALDGEQEGGESESSEPTIEVTVGTVETEDPHEAMGAGKLREDAPASATGGASRQRTNGSSKAAKLYTVVPNFGLSTRTRKAPFSSLRGARDAVNLAGVKLSMATTINSSASAFGEMMPTYTFANTKATAKDGSVIIEADLNADYKWGVNNGGKIDVPSGTAGVVTKDNYAKIVSDLTPKLEESCWRAPRSTYWSEAICARHEKYHASDETAWATSNAVSVLQTYFTRNPIALTDDERKDATVVKSKTDAAMVKALKALDAASWNFYTGGATTYCTRVGEIRAFGDGKQPYLDLAAAVDAQGKKLAAATAPPPTPPTTATPPT